MVSPEKKKKSLSNIPLLKKFFSFTESKTGVIGIDITFAEATLKDYQLLAYAVYPKVALIDGSGDCKLVDDV
jgi:hypothetical protein